MRFTPSRSLSSSQLSRRSVALAFMALPLAATLPVRAAPGADLLRARQKVNAYQDLIEGTQPLQAMWRRYTSLVNPERGPTGREIRINGLSAPRDISPLVGAAEAQIIRGPAFAECDAAIAGFIRLHGETMPALADAADHFERGLQREDGGARARELHERLRKTMPQLLAARADAQARLEPIRGIVEEAELSAYERMSGRDGRWHIRRATVEARRVMAVFPRAGGVIDIERLDAALAGFDRIVEDTEAFGRDNPQGLLAFGRSPRGFADGIRRVRERIVAFPASPKRWAPEIADIDAPFQSLTRMADAMLRPVA
jgi:hypothetical protein